MAESTHKVEVVPVVLEKHPNADALSIVRVGQYQVCARTADWQGVEKAAYIQPDSVVPDNEQFAFLGGDTRIRVRRFRGELSQGLLVPAPEGSNIGDDVAEILGVTRYEAPLPASAGGEVERNPLDYLAPKYDVENWYKYSRYFEDGEQVVMTEKIHGANARFFYNDDEDRFYVGSHNTWKKENPNNMFWMAFYKCPWLADFCKANPKTIVYGEVFGWVQTLRYGAQQPGTFDIRVFDLMWNNEFVDWEIVKDALDTPQEKCEGTLYENGVQINRPWLLKWVPVLYEGPYNAEELKKLAEGQTNVWIDPTNTKKPHYREGGVVKPVKERRERGARVCLKIVSNTYMENDGKDKINH